MAGNNVPSLNTLRRFQVNIPGAIEVVRQKLYDSLIYPAAGTTRLQFFALPKGQGITSALGATPGAVKNINDTNLDLAGQIPAYQNYQIESIEVHFLPGGLASANTFGASAPGQFSATVAPSPAGVNRVNDANVFYTSGSLSLFIGSKEYLREAPLANFPPKARFGLAGSVSSNGATTGLTSALDASAIGRPYFVQPQITIPSNQNFSISLEWPAAVALPSGNNGRVMVQLDGYLFRNSQ